MRYERNKDGVVFNMVKEFDPEKVNLHTHSYYCGHGMGELIEYVEVAKEEGLDLLGFSEHCPTPTNRWPGSRMHFDQLGEYLDECRELEKTTTGISLITGLECDWDPTLQSWYEDYIIETLKVDYLIFGVHSLSVKNRDYYIKEFCNDKKALHAYTDLYIASLSSGLFDIGAHPDLFGASNDRWDDETIACSNSILECASTLNIPLEINGHGLNKSPLKTATGKRAQYPLTEFWELSKNYPIKIVANSDAHYPEDVKKQVDDANRYAKEIGVELSKISVETGIDGRKKLLFD